MGAMQHHVYTGTFAALEERLTATISGFQMEDPLAPVAVLVGSGILAAYLKGRMAMRGKPAANVRFHTFPDLVERLCPCRGETRRKPRLPRLGASLILEQILEEQTPAVFAPVAGFAGFRGALLDTFRDLRDAGLAPHSVDQSLSGMGGLTADRVDHLAALAGLYRRFRARIASYRDLAEDFHEACAAASAAEANLGTRALLIYGIYDVTGVQADLLGCLRHVLELTYFIPFANDEASGFARPFLEARCRELDVAPETLPEEFRKDSLGVLARRIFPCAATQTEGGPPAALAADGSFSLISVPGESRAAVEVIREVFRAVQDRVITGFHEAAVILRNPDEEIPFLTETFRLRNIPYFVHRGSAFNLRPLSRAVAAIAVLDQESFSRQSILTAMELVAAALPASAAAQWDVADWRALTNDARFLAGIEAWDRGTSALLRETDARLRRLEADAGAGDAEGEDGERRISIPLARKQAEAARLLRAGWTDLRRAAADWPAACSGQEWSRLLRDKLAPLLGSSADWQAFAAVFDDLSMLGDVLGGAGAPARISRARMTAALAESLAALSHPEGRFQRRGVNLISAAAARGLRFPLVIVAGLEEGRFPARLRQDPLLFDEERRRIGHPARLALKSLRGEEERLLFSMAVNSAGKRLVLITSRLDESSDRERIPSDFFLRAAAAARGTPALSLAELTEEKVPGLRTVSLNAPGPGRKLTAVDEGEIRLRLITENPRSARAVLAALAQAEPALMTGPMAYDRSRWIRQLTEYDGRLMDAALLRWTKEKLGLDSGQISASRIEEYAKCPYLFYLRRVLELEPWVESGPVEGMDPLERGSGVHEILEQFVKGFAGETLVESKCELLIAMARAVLEKARPAGLPDLLWEIERDRLLAMLQNWLAFEVNRNSGDLRPAHLERSFGSFPGLPAAPGLRIQGRRHTFDFRGRIDRIDLSRDRRRARVVDYKTGRLPDTMAGRKKTALMAGEKIQLAIYGCALSCMEDLAAVELVEGEYLHLQPGDGRIVPCSFDEEAMRAAARRLPEMLEVIRDGMEQGAFFARTSGRVRPQGHCDYCEYLSICGRDRMQREQSKASDPAGQRFLALGALDAAGEDEG